MCYPVKDAKEMQGRSILFDALNAMTSQVIYSVENAFGTTLEVARENQDGWTYFRVSIIPRRGDAEALTLNAASVAALRDALNAQELFGL